MSVPLPIDIVAGALPFGLKGNLQQIFEAYVEAMSATVDANFLTGLVGGPAPPTSDIGPWANGNEWWFWDPTTGQYQPSEQGSPVGTIVMWGGPTIPKNTNTGVSTGPPTNWLLCDGTAVARTVFSRLFQAIGETWGPGDGQSTFNLPPPAKFFINAPGFVAATGVPIDAGSTGQGVNARGGSQNFTLIPDNLPQLSVFVPTKAIQVNQSSPTNLIGIAVNPGGDDGSNTVYRVVQPYTNAPLGSPTQPVSLLPPFCAINFIIKAQ